MNPYPHAHWRQGQRAAHPRVQLESMQTHSVYQAHSAHPAQHMMAAASEPPSRPPYDPQPFRELESALIAALDKMNNNSSARMDMMEIAIGNLARVTDDALQVAKSARRECKEGFDRLQGHLLRSAQASIVKSERLAMILGDPENRSMDTEQQNSTLMGRIEQLELAITELTETVADPDAGRPAIVRHEAAVNTSPQSRPTVDVAIDAIDLVPPIPHADMGIQAEQPTFVEAGVEARPPSQEMVSTGSQTVFTPSAHLVTTMSGFYTPSFVPQPLAPASWSPIDTASDSSISRATSKAPSPPPRPTTSARTSMSMSTAVPSTSRTQLSPRPSSIFDEQEIMDELDNVSQYPTSPVGAIPQSPPRTSPIPKEPGPFPSPPGYDVGNESPTKPSHGAGIFSASGTAAPRPQDSPLPNGFTRLSARSSPPPLSASASDSSLSSVSSSNPSPPLAPQRPQPRVAQLRPAQLPPPQLEPSPSLSPSPPSPYLQPAVPPTPPPQLQELQEHLSSVLSPLTRASSLSSMSSLSSLSTAIHPEPAHTQTSQPQKRPKQYAARGGKTGKSASAVVRVKKERGEEMPLTSARPAKRRRTLGTDVELKDEPGNSSSASASTSAAVNSGRGTSTRGRGRGRSKGRGGGGENGGGRGGGKSSQQQLLITPIKEPVQQQQQPKTRYEPPMIGTDCPWPGKVLGEETSRREFVQCDNCEGWYHFGCVGIITGDPRLDPSAQFYCPPCETSEAVQIQRRAERYKAAACLRPDCDFPGAAEDTNEYFVDRIIGRRPFKPEIDTDVRESTEYMWLVKWDGYKADLATWAANEHLGECGKFIEEFEQAAEIEGRDLDARDNTILLNEAAAAGWAGP
ncbi:hypothetical protein DICSQDRAFT_141680 [Dichomitus squalens LYAD-421 SS1]|uniref:Chromo domain-containing protein n=1 Tax=Dichomitus squalens (strain LYAD-421) TaxID=732165 RepID=R7SJ26_DICSQ|nr:uncharacterized protein DICSQDRAFT_141680 [Dichomitus squalens LYAD-421 SS1]EJF55883.1 hypothetical protein DICSQDRAFT_141680 [Dichomitus squalens LYAD-421 SS1]